MLYNTLKLKIKSSSIENQLMKMRKKKRFNRILFLISGSQKFDLNITKNQDITIRSFR